MKKIILILMLVVGAMAQVIDPPVTSRAKSHWREKYPTPLKDTVLSNFDGGVGVEWTVVGGDSVRDDAVNVRNGSQSMRLYCSGTTNTTILKTFTAKNLTDYDQFSITFHIDDTVKYQADSSNSTVLHILIGTTAARYWLRDLKLTVLNAFDSGWYKVALHKNQFAKTNDPTWDSITRVQVRLVAQTGLSRNITYDQITAQKSPVQQAGVTFWFEPNDVNYMKYTNGIFEKYGYKFSMSLKGKQGEPFVDSLVELQDNGHDIMCYPWNVVDLRTLTPAGVDTELVRTKNLMISNGLRGNAILAYSHTTHDRMVDSVAHSKGFDFGRGVPMQIYPSTILPINVFPIYDANLAIGAWAYNGQTLAKLKEIVDTAISKKNVITMLIHGTNVNSDVASNIDTGRLDSLLQYCYEMQLAGNLGNVGKITDYMVYAPDSCIDNKSHIDNTIVDSIAKLADSMRVVLKVLNGTEWDSIAGSAMKKGGSLCTLKVRGLTGTYTVKSFGVANSGHIDSGNIAYEATFTTAITVTTQPENDTVLTGQQGTFSVDYTGDSVNVAWYINSEHSVGDTLDTLIYIGNYGDSIWVKLYNGNDTVYTDTVFLVVISVDSIRPNPWYRGKVFSIYGTNLTNESLILSIGDTLLGTYEFISSGLINDTIPANMPRGKYPFKVNGEVLDSIRVFVPKQGW